MDDAYKDKSTTPPFFRWLYSWYAVPPNVQVTGPHYIIAAYW